MRIIAIASTCIILTGCSFTNRNFETSSQNEIRITSELHNLHYNTTYKAHPGSIVLEASSSTQVEKYVDCLSDIYYSDGFSSGWTIPKGKHKIHGSVEISPGVWTPFIQRTYYDQLLKDQRELLFAIKSDGSLYEKYYTVSPLSSLSERQGQLKEWSGGAKHGAKCEIALPETALTATCKAVFNEIIYSPIGLVAMVTVLENDTIRQHAIPQYAAADICGVKLKVLSLDNDGITYKALR